MAELIIERLGQRGEGIADGPIYVPYALAGEHVQARVSGDRAVLEKILTSSTDRIEPVCQYYGLCGGCAVQALKSEAYQQWKRGLVVEALRYARLDVEVLPLQNVHGEGRRRATFHARMDQGKAICGFMQARSHDIVAIESCPLLAAQLAEAPRIAQEVSQALAHRGKPLDLVVTASLNGLDVDVRGCGPLGEADLQKLTRLAASLNLARLANHGSIIIERLPPLVQMGLAQVKLPPGAFLQATVLAEEALSAAVVSAVDGSRKIADLFCGVGTFALRLAQKATVLAVENDGPALKALQDAARRPDLREIKVEQRDLFLRPLQVSELAQFDAVVFDPPRAGAEAQSRQIAKSEIAKVVAVSCHVQSFIRDARILVDAGYRLESVTPFDQFLYSPHVELVGVFSRQTSKAKRRIFG